MKKERERKKTARVFKWEGEKSRECIESAVVKSLSQRRKYECVKNSGMIALFFFKPKSLLETNELIEAPKQRGRKWYWEMTGRRETRFFFNMQKRNVKKKIIQQDNGNLKGFKGNPLTNSLEVVLFKNSHSLFNAFLQSADRLRFKSSGIRPGHCSIVRPKICQISATGANIACWLHTFCPIHI